MRVPPVQTFEHEYRVYDGLSDGVLVVEESRLVAEVEDPIRVLIGDDREDGDDYVVNAVLPLREEPDCQPQVAVCFSEGS